MCYSFLEGKWLCCMELTSNFWHNMITRHSEFFGLPPRVLDCVTVWELGLPTGVAGLIVFSFSMRNHCLFKYSDVLYSNWSMAPGKPKLQHDRMRNIPIALWQRIFLLTNCLQFLKRAILLSSVHKIAQFRFWASECVLSPPPPYWTSQGLLVNSLDSHRCLKDFQSNCVILSHHLRLE